MSDTLQIDGKHGSLTVHRWTPEGPRYAVLLAHGYGEHAGRYTPTSRIASWPTERW